MISWSAPQRRGNWSLGADRPAASVGALFYRVPSGRLLSPNPCHGSLPRVFARLPAYSMTEAMRPTRGGRGGGRTLML